MAPGQRGPRLRLRPGQTVITLQTPADTLAGGQAPTWRPVFLGPLLT